MKINAPSWTSSNTISAVGKYIKASASQLTHVLHQKTNIIGIENLEKKMRNEFLGYLRGYFIDNIAFDEEEKNNLEQSDFYRNISPEDKIFVDGLIMTCLQKNTIRKQEIGARGQKLNEKQKEQEDFYNDTITRANHHHERMQEIMENIESILYDAERAFHRGNYTLASSEALRVKSTLDYESKILSFFLFRFASFERSIPLVKKHINTPRGLEYDRIMHGYRLRASDILNECEKRLKELRKSKKDVLRGKLQDNVSLHAGNEVPEGQWEKLHVRGGILSGFKLDDLPYQMEIIRRNVTIRLNGEDKKGVIVRQTRAGRQCAFVDDCGNPLIASFFGNYRLKIIEDPEDKEETCVQIEVQHTKDQPFYALDINRPNQDQTNTEQQEDNNNHDLNEHIIGEDQVFPIISEQTNTITNNIVPQPENNTEEKADEKTSEEIISIADTEENTTNQEIPATSTDIEKEIEDLKAKRELELKQYSTQAGVSLDELNDYKITEDNSLLIGERRSETSASYQGTSLLINNIVSIEQVKKMEENLGREETTKFLISKLKELKNRFTATANADYSKKLDLLKTKLEETKKKEAIKTPKAPSDEKNEKTAEEIIGTEQTPAIKIEKMENKDSTLKKVITTSNNTPIIGEKKFLREVDEGGFFKEGKEHNSYYVLFNFAGDTASYRFCGHKVRSMSNYDAVLKNIFDDQKTYSRKAEDIINIEDGIVKLINGKWKIITPAKIYFPQKNGIQNNPKEITIQETNSKAESASEQALSQSKKQLKEAIKTSRELEDKINKMNLTPTEKWNVKGKNPTMGKTSFFKEANEEREKIINDFEKLEKETIKLLRTKDFKEHMNTALNKDRFYSLAEELATEKWRKEISPKEEKKMQEKLNIVDTKLNNISIQLYSEYIKYMENLLAQKKEEQK